MGCCHLLRYCLNAKSFTSSDTRYILCIYLLHQTRIEDSGCLDELSEALFEDSVLLTAEADFLEADFSQIPATREARVAHPPLGLFPLSSQYLPRDSAEKKRPSKVEDVSACWPIIAIKCSTRADSLVVESSSSISATSFLFKPTNSRSPSAIFSGTVKVRSRFLVLRRSGISAGRPQAPGSNRLLCLMLGVARSFIKFQCDGWNFLHYSVTLAQLTKIA